MLGYTTIRETQDECISPNTCYVCPQSSHIDLGRVVKSDYSRAASNELSKRAIKNSCGGYWLARVEIKSDVGVRGPKKYLFEGAEAGGGIHES